MDIIIFFYEYVNSLKILKMLSILIPRVVHRYLIIIYLYATFDEKINPYTILYCIFYKYS